MNRRLLITSLAAASVALPSLAQKGAAKPASAPRRPNILFVISDDQSYPYASAYGNSCARTPNFDRVARMGILFNNAYVTSPGSSPSRASILTGRYPWGIEQAGTHGSDFPRAYRSFPEMLQAAGYHIGFTGKGWGPGNWKNYKWPYNPAGPEYGERTLTPPYRGIWEDDYAGNFEDFMKARGKDQPFYFWFGCKEPHRIYEQDSWKREGRNLSEAIVPGDLPDVDLVRGDVLDYATEIEWFDKQLGKILRTLEDAGELGNTLIMITADNGMPFPRGKANCYDEGVHVPFAVAWPGVIPGGRVVDDLVSMVDVAPTVLDATGAPKLGEHPFSGKSMMPLFMSHRQGWVNSPEDQAVYSNRERHSSVRYDNWGYPVRMMRTERYVYIRNLHPERWPMGDPRAIVAMDGTLGPVNSAFHDIDVGPTVLYLKENWDKPEVKNYFELSMAKRPGEELFDIAKDPYCRYNIIDVPAVQADLARLRGMMDRKLRETEDSRVTGSDPEIWETYPRYSGNRYFPHPETGEIPPLPEDALRRIERTKSKDREAKGGE